MTRFALTTLCVLVCTACGGTSSGPDVSLFEYERSAPLALENGERASVNATVQTQLTFLGGRGERLRGIYVHPEGSGPWPVVLFSPSSAGDEREQVAEAELLAQRDLASLLVSPPPSLFECKAERDLEIYAGYVVGRRRAIDLVSLLPGADAERIAAVGFSWGASVTGTLVGVDDRLRGAVIKSGRGHQSEWMREECAAALGPDRIGAYVEQVSAIDPVEHVSHAEPTELLFQNGTYDYLTPREDVTSYEQAASEPSTLRWYEAAHDLDLAAQRDRVAWLAQVLA